MKSKPIKVYDDRAYMLCEKIYTEYERCEIHFVNHNGEMVFPHVFGRAGDGFNVTFSKTDNNRLQSTGANCRACE